MPKPLRAKRSRLIVLLAVILAASACAGQSDSPAAQDPYRHDLEPLTKRWPVIGNPVSVTWSAGDLVNTSPARIDIPGPGVFWLDAIVELEPTVADSLRDRATTPPKAGPTLREGLASHLPPGQLATSPALDAAFVTPHWTTHAYLQVSGNVLVITAGSP